MRATERVAIVWPGGFDPLVVGVVGGGAAGGDLAGLIQRPAQGAGALAGEMAPAAMAVAVIDGDVQAGVSHGFA